MGGGNTRPSLGGEGEKTKRLKFYCSKHVWYVSCFSNSVVFKSFYKQGIIVLNDSHYTSDTVEVTCVPPRDSEDFLRGDPEDAREAVSNERHKPRVIDGLHRPLRALQGDGEEVRGVCLEQEALRGDDAV